MCYFQWILINYTREDWIVYSREVSPITWSDCRDEHVIRILVVYVA